MSMYYLNPATGKYELQGAPHVDAYSKGETDALIAENAGVQMELLWENASPASDFAGQDIMLDLSSCSAVGIVWDSTSIVCYPVGNFIWYTNCQSQYLRARRGSVETDRVTFSDGLLTYYDTTSDFTNRNDVAIPYKIYGIKGGKTT